MFGSECVLTAYQSLFISRSFNLRNLNSLQPSESLNSHDLETRKWVETLPYNTTKQRKHYSEESYACTLFVRASLTLSLVQQVVVVVVGKGKKRRDG